MLYFSFTLAAPASRLLRLPPALLVTDFDSTVTLKDTLSSLVSLADTPSLFDKASSYYNTRYEEVQQLVEAGRVAEALVRLQEVESEAIDMVVNERILAGITTAAITKAAAKIPLRPGATAALRAAAAAGTCLPRARPPTSSPPTPSCSAPLAPSWFKCVPAPVSACLPDPRPPPLNRAALGPGVPVHVCSANWSRSWIATALLECGDAAVAGIHCNHLVMDASGRATGGLHRTMVGAADKARCLASLRKECADATSDGRPCVFVGDALPDLTAMREADIGIVIGDNGTFRKALAASDGSQPLRELSEAVTECGALRAGLYTASGWDAIAEVLQLTSNRISGA